MADELKHWRRSEVVTDENFETAVSETERRLNEELGEPLRQQGLRVEAVAALGEPAVEIVRTASNKGCDLIAMSTHGRGRLGRAFLGSVTSKVVHSSRLPTLIINPDRAKKYGEEGGTISRIMAPLDGSDLAETSLPYVTELARKFSLEVDLVQVVYMDTETSSTARSMLTCKLTLKNGLRSISGVLLRG